jgi:hypothetical protein
MSDDTKDVKAEEKSVGTLLQENQGQYENILDKFENFRKEEEGINSETAQVEKSDIMKSSNMADDKATTGDEVIEPEKIDEEEEKEEETTTETSPEEDVTDDKSEQNNDKTKKKTVPHSAFHAEREKRKLAQAREKAKEEKLELALREIEKLKQTVSQPAEESDDDYLDDTEKTVRDLKNKIKTLEDWKNSNDKTVVENQKAEKQKNLNARVSGVDNKLSEEGFPGFSVFSTLVGDEISKMISEDADNKVYDTEDGWAEIYKTKVFPKVSKIFTGKDKEEMFEQKQASKEKANLITKPGQVPIKEEAKDDLTHEQYLKESRELRKDLTLSGV